MPARLLRRMETPVSRWVTLVAKEVQIEKDQMAEIYHCLAQADYVAILARTPAGLIPIVHQYRPAVDNYTWELPSGLVDLGECPEETCRRELLEETGLNAKSMIHLGSYYPDTGRLENLLHAFCVRTSEPDPTFIPEQGMRLKYVSMEELNTMIRAGEFRHQLHLGVFAAASVKLKDWQDP